MLRKQETKDIWHKLVELVHVLSKKIGELM